MAKPKIYMGAYSGETWIRKILDRDIKLPPYQRNFVWDWEVRGKKFLESMNKNLFIPTVTLGDYEGETHLIDGQQRLTALLCLKYRFWPKDEKKTVDTEDDSLREINFNFEHIQNAYEDFKKNGGTNIDDFFKTEIEKKYDLLTDKVLSNVDFNKIFIPYCHIQWDQKDLKAQQAYYSRAFDRINSGGMPLKAREVRQALYWVHGETFAKRFFQEDFETQIIINSIPLDFISYLTMLAVKDRSNVLKNRSRSNEPKFGEYIAEFVTFLADDGSEENDIWDSEWCQKITESSYQKFQNEFKKLGKNNFTSVIEADYYFFGLIYHIYEGKSMDETHLDDIKIMLDNKIKSPKLSGTNDTKEKYDKTPNTLGRIRTRMQDSIESWDPFLRMASDD